MLNVSDYFQSAVGADTRRVHVEIPLRVSAPGLVIGETTETATSVSLAVSGCPVLQSVVISFETAPSSFTVEISQNGHVYHSETITGNTETVVTVTGFTVYYPDTITVSSGSAISVTEIFPGYVDTWTEDDLTGLSIQMQTDFSGLKLPYGTASITLDNSEKRFDPRNKSGLFLSIEEGQPVPVRLGVDTAQGTEYVPCGVFFQHDGGWRTADSGMTIKWSLVDIVGLISDRAFTVPETLPETISGWLTALVSQLGDSFSEMVTVDETLADTALTCGAEALDGKNCGDILRWLCQATGTFPRADASTGYLTVEPLQADGNIYRLDNMESLPTIALNDRISDITFKLPEDNTVIIGGNSAASAQSVSVDNPFVTDDTGAIAASKGILAAYGGSKYTIRGRGNPSSELGDRMLLEVEKDIYVTARLVSQSLEFSGGVLKGCKSELIAGDGTEFEYSAILTGNGVWTAPRGASSIRVVIVGGGDYGADRDTGGAGGRIWYGTIPVNRGQVFHTYIGQGGTASRAGEDTVFGNYTSAYGKRFDPAYYDAVSGLPFGRSNNSSPASHSGDGGSYRVKGASGTILLYWNIDPQWKDGEWFFAGEVHSGEVDA